MSIPETQQYRDLWAAKTAAKKKVMEAVAFASMAELKAKDPERYERKLTTEAKAQLEHDDPQHYWDIVESQGFANGVEGEKQAEAQKLCDDLYTTHPEYFAIFEGKTSEQLAELATAFRLVGADDDATLVTMYELAKFERQAVGGKVKAKIRLPGPGGK